MEKLNKKNIEDILALTPLQEGMLFHYLQDPHSGLYFEQLRLEISGDIDGRHFEKAWDIVTETNEMLRTVFRWEKLEKPSQITLKEHKCKVIFYDLSDKDSSQKKTLLEEIKNKDRRETFNLHQVPFRVILCKLEEKKYVIIISNHHILYDGWSNGIILKEFFIAYHELCHGERSLKLPVKPPFKEFIKGMQSQDRNKQEQFWKNYLAGLETVTQLPIKKRPEDTTKGEVEEYTIILEKDTRGKLEVLAKNNRVTLAAVFYTAWGILLQKYCGSEDVLFGTAVSGRSAGVKGIEDMVGLFLNTLPLRVQSGPGAKITGVLTGIENRLREREEFENTPLVEIRDCCDMPGSASLFDTMVAIENYPLDNRLIPEGCLLSLHSYSISEMTHYDLTVGIIPVNGMEIKFSYRRELFEKETIERLAGHLKGILRNMMENPGAALSQLEIISSEEKNRILYEFNDTAVEYPGDKTIHRLFADQAEKSPDRIALVGAAGGETKKRRREEEKIKEDPFGGIYAPGAVHLSYRDLNDQSNRLAHILTGKGVKPDIIVGIMAERSIEMIIGILGILKSGGAYLPIDPDYPGDRIDYMLEDSSTGILLTDDWSCLKNSFLSVLSVSSVAKPAPQALLNLSEGRSFTNDQLAYIIYTSGSTGKPKGVLVEHSSVVNLIISQKEQFNINENERILQFSNICFDASVEQIFIAFSSGAALVLIDKDVLLDANRFETLITSRSITHIHAVPSFLSNMKLGEGAKSQLKRVVSGGDICPLKLAAAWMRYCDFYNEYGPTETTVTSIEMKVKEVDEALSHLPIGRPINNTTVYLLDSGINLVPLGVTGELYIGGKGLARGYLNRPELTAEKFDHDLWDYQDYHDEKREIEKIRSLEVKKMKRQVTVGATSNEKFLPGGPGGAVFSKSAPPGRRRQKIYKTGDLARWLPDGKIEFSGRMDSQVKVRGFRIELGEIENCLSLHPAVGEAVVTTGTDDTGSHFICAYVIPCSRGHLEISQLKDHLQKKLPAFMIPAYFVTLDHMPMTSTGKIDQKSLPHPKTVSAKPYTPPVNEIETRLVETWSEVLGIDRSQIGIDDNFFELGGHSLKIVGLIGRIHKKLDIKIPFKGIFEAPTVRELAAYIGKQEQSRCDAVSPAEKKEYYLLSSVQGRLYFLYRMAPGSIVYNMTGLMRLEGAVETGKLEAAFQKIIARHESLRTSFHMKNEEPVQRIHDKENINFRLTRDKLQANEKLPVNKMIENFIRPFDLSRAPLLRVVLIEEKDREYILVVDMHHITADGVSIDLLTKEFAALYSGETLPAPRIQYKDFSEWQGSKTQQDKLKQQGDFWLKEFQDEIPGLHLPIDYPRPAVQSFEGSGIFFHIDPAQTRALHLLALKERTTLFMVLLSGLTLLLSKICNQEDIIIGTPVAGRRHPDLEHIMGMFVNTLPLRNFPCGEKTLKEFLGEVKERTLRALSHQDYPYADLVEKLVKERDASRNPLFDVLFVQQETVNPAGGKEVKANGGNSFKITPYPYETYTTKFDLCLVAVEKENELHFKFEYGIKLFKKETILRFTHYFQGLISTLPGQLTAKLAEIEIITEKEKHHILFELNETAAAFSRDKTIDQLFEKQAGIIPGNTSVVYGDQHLTYGVLNEKANGLARILRRKGVKRDIIAGIMVSHCLEMIIGMLAVLKAGGAYLPIDPDYPEARKKFMIEDSRTRVLMTQKELLHQNCNIPETISKENIIDLQDENNYWKTTGNLPNKNKPDDLIYVIYTSGTTGQPKGVLIGHKGFVNLVYAHQKVFEENIESRVSQVAGISFDAMAFEVWPCLSNGASLYIAANDIRMDPVGMNTWLISREITISFQSTMMFERLLKEEWPGKGVALKALRTAGDKLNRLPVRQYPFRLYNLYGPTEDTVWTTWTEVTVETEEGKDPPIGKPVGNHRVYIVDISMHLQPVGVPGELCISGIGLARGYLNRPGLTAEKFDQDLGDFQDYHDGYHRSYPSYKSYISKKVYKTGDLARWLPDGNIDFIGRIDSQVKIRGFRIELQEIESQLLKINEIKEAVVVARENEASEKFLCAYIVSPKEFKLTKLRYYLSGKLPGYMIPSYFMRLDRIPLTLNGKVDGKALPAPGIEAGQHYQAPRDEIERKLLHIWSGVLGIEKEKIGINDNFFYLGGHSLKVAVLASRIHQELHINIPLTRIFKTPHIQGLAACIKDAARSKPIPVQPVEKKEYYPLSSAQRRLYILQQMDVKGGTGYNIPSVWQLEGNLIKEKLELVFNGLIQRHESLRTFFTTVNDEPVQRIGEENYKLQITNYKSQITNKKERSGTVQSPTIQKPPQSKVFAGGPGGRFFQKESPWPPEAIIKNFIRPFDLSRAPLLRVGLIKRHFSQKEKEDRYLLMVDMHHIISDGLSIGIFIEEFIELYVGKSLSVLKLQYRDYSQWHNRQIEREFMKKQQTYWLKQFAGEVPVLDLPVDYPRPLVQGFAGRTLHFEMDKQKTAALKSLARDRDVTLFMLLISLYTVFLCKLSGQEDIVVGTPVANRRHTDLAGIIGMFVNTLAMRNFPVGEKNFSQFLEEIKENTIKAFENQDYLYEELVGQVKVERDTGRNPLFDTMFALQNMDTPDVQIPGLKVMPYHYEGRISKFDLTLTAVEIENRLAFNFEYCTDLFKKETIQRFIVFFKRIAANIIETDETRISGIEIMTGEEKNRILLEFNDTKTEYPRDKTIHQLFAEQVEMTPGHLALLGPGYDFQQCNNMSHWSHMSYISITYRELNNQANRLAQILIEKGVKPDIIVGIMVERSIEMIVGILAILKAGGAYLPIDPQYPEERKKYMLKDSGAKILLTSDAINRVPTPQRLSFHPSTLPPFLHSNPSNLAYIIYTSGTTGRPKGALIQHQNVVRLLFNDKFQFDFSDRDTWTLFHSFCFDFSVWEMYGALLYGGKLVIVPKMIARDTAGFLELLNREAVTILNQIPPAFYNLIDEDLNSQQPGKKLYIKYVIFGGEALNPLKLKHWQSRYPQTRLINMFGITETTVHVTYKEITEKDMELNISNIGKPIPTLNAYILDKHFKLVPVGVMGEICVGGAGVARGYLNRPQLTAERFCLRRPGAPRRGGPICCANRLCWNSFVSGSGRDMPRSSNYRSNRSHKSYVSYFKTPTKKNYMQPCSHASMPPPHHPITPSPHSPLYRTGDLARHLVNGDIEYLGRIDQQVKIRGFRIELGEIESRLSGHENVKEAIVIDRTDGSGEKYLCAYVVYREPNDVKQTELKSYLTQTLPQYMIPAHFVEIEKIPLNPSGKVDRNILPEPGTRPGSEYVAPATEKEREIAEIWKQVLGLEKISIHENFFDVGGNSLKIIKLAIQLKKHLEVEITTATVFQYTTIASQAKYIAWANKKEKQDPGAMEKLETGKVKNRLKQKRDKSRL